MPPMAILADLLAWGAGAISFAVVMPHVAVNVPPVVLLPIAVVVPPVTAAAHRRRHAASSCRPLPLPLSYRLLPCCPLTSPCCRLSPTSCCLSPSSCCMSPCCPLLLLCVHCRRRAALSPVATVVPPDAVVRLPVVVILALRRSCAARHRHQVARRCAAP